VKSTCRYHNKLLSFTDLLKTIELPSSSFLQTPSVTAWWHCLEWWTVYGTRPLQALLVPGMRWSRRKSFAERIGIAIYPTMSIGPSSIIKMLDHLIDFLKYLSNNQFNSYSV